MQKLGLNDTFLGFNPLSASCFHGLSGNFFFAVANPTAFSANSPKKYGGGCCAKSPRAGNPSQARQSRDSVIVPFPSHRRIIETVETLLGITYDVQQEFSPGILGCTDFPVPHPRK